MVKFVLAIVLAFIGSSVYAGECANGRCGLRHRTSNVTKEVISVPSTNTRQVVRPYRNTVRRSVYRVR